jgi:hypothetical protein
MQIFKFSGLSTISKLPGDPQLARYIEDRIIEASLRKLADYGPLQQLELYCKYRGRRPTGKLPVPGPIIEQKSDIWIRQKGRIALALDLRLDLSPISSALLSDGLYGRLGEVKVLHMTREMFKTLLEKVKNLGGRLTSVHLLDVREPAPLDVLQASYTLGVEEFPGIKKAMASGRIKRLGFHLNLGDDRFSFWIANFGNGTLYTPPNPEPHHIGTLLEFFEDLWDPGHSPIAFT